MSAITTSSPASELTSRELKGDADKLLWNSFVASLPEGDVLQAWEWAAIKSEWKPLRIGVFREENLVAGAAILIRNLPLVGAFYYAPRGPLMLDWSDKSSLELLLKSIKEKAIKDGAAFLKIDPAVPIERNEVIEILTNAGFKPPATTDAQGFGGTQPRCVMQLDLLDKTRDDLLKSFKPQTRRNIKLAMEKHGVRFTDNITREHLAIFNDLMKTTGERDGFHPRPLSYFEAIWDNLVPNGYAKLFLTEYEGEYLSGALCFKIGDKCWYVYGASSNEHRNVMPNYAMQWDMIQWALDSGCAWYDFRGVSPRRRTENESVEQVEKEDHLQGLNRFKEGFGTRYVEYIGEFDLVYNPLAYWIFTYGKPTAQKIIRKLRNR